MFREGSELVMTVEILLYLVVGMKSFSSSETRSATVISV